MRARSILNLILSLLCLVASAVAQDDSYEKDASTEINVKNADIAAVVRIFSKKTKRNYILDERVKGKISIYLPGKVSSDESTRILDAVLQMKGFTSVPIGENLWKIVPLKEAIQSTIPTIMQDSAELPTASMITRILTLKYMAADEAKQILQPLVSSDGLMNAYTGTNSLIIIDSEDNIDRLVRIVDSMDVPFSDRDMTIVDIEHAEAVDVAQKLTDILLENSEGSQAGNPLNSTASSIRARLNENQPARTTPAAGTASASGAGTQGATIAARGREPKIIADERTNSIMIVADEDTTARIRALIAQLDSPVDKSGERYYVYRCKHADAEELANVLGGLGGNGASGATNNRRPSSFFSGNSDPNAADSNSGGQNRAQNRLQSQNRTPGQSRNASQSSGSASAVNLGENISISADPSTNSLIIKAGKTDYLKLLELLKELDVKRRQVLVEAMLLEVAVDDTVNLNTEWLASAGGADGGVVAKNSFSNNLATLIQDPVALSNFTVAAATSGTLTLPGNVTIPTQSILINAAQRNTNVNVLSAPNILATDNQPAEIVVGQNVPFLASTSTNPTNLDNTFNQIDRQDVGITLRITPQISSNDFVRLEIFTEVSSVVAATLASDLGPTTTIRTSETVVTTKDSQMVVIGGLMSDEVSDDNTGVPFLKDIPVLGHMFRNTSDSYRRTNLLIFITPRIIRDQHDARDESRLRSGEFGAFIDSNEMYPDRQEILDSPNFDQVAELDEWSGTKPTTILPAKRSEQAQQSTEPLELHVAPRLPESPRFRQKTDVANKSLAQAGSPAFLVLEVLDGKELESELPFQMYGSYVAVKLPDDASAKVQQFFQVGKNYQYSLGENSLSLRAVGAFTSADEARGLYAELGESWHSLSPFEIMNIGQGPWRQN